MDGLNRNIGPITYDIKGQKIANRRRSDQHVRTTVTKRSPPENIEDYMDYAIYFRYEKQEGECIVD